MYAHYKPKLTDTTCTVIDEHSIGDVSGCKLSTPHKQFAKRKFPFTTVIPLFAAGTIIKKLPNCSMDIHHLVNSHTRIHPSPHPLTLSHCTITTYYILHLIVHNRFQQNGRFFRRTRHIPKHIPTRKPKATAHTMNVLNGIIIAERR